MDHAKGNNVSKIFGWRETKEEDVYKILSRNVQESIFFYNYAEGISKWGNIRPEIKTTFYCPEDPQWDSSVIIHVQGPIYTVAVFWPYLDYSYLLSAFSGNDIINKSNEPKILFGIPREIFMPFEQSLRSLGVSISDTYNMQTYLMSAEKARNLDIKIPEDIRISSLDHSHASIVNSTWSAARQESIKLVNDLIDMNHTTGMYTKKDSKLVCWMLESYYGVGMLYTLPEYRRKGYASIVVKSLTKKIGEEGKDVLIMAKEENITPNLMFMKLGFEKYTSMKMIRMCSSSNDD